MSYARKRKVVSFSEHVVKWLTDLFSYWLPAEIGRPVALERLTEQRVKRAGYALGRAGVAGHGESGDVGQLEAAVVVERRGSVQTVGVLEVLGQTL